MSRATRQLISFTIGVVWLSMAATPALAYVGPGAGLGAIGTLFAVIGSVLLLIVGFLWYPIKRLLGGKKAKRQSNKSEDSSKDSSEKPAPSSSDES